MWLDHVVVGAHLEANHAIDLRTMALVIAAAHARSTRRPVDQRRR